MASGDERLTGKDYCVLIVKSVFFFVVMCLALFLCAGRLSYRQGWALFGLLAVYVVLSFFLLGKMPGLVRERMKPGPGTNPWDTVLLAVYGPLSFGLMIFAALDSGRFGWSGSLPVWAYVAGWALFLVSYGFVTWAMAVNRWFSSVARIQTDRGQKVVTQGPYRFVRHPGYLGGIVGFFATSIVLGSLWGLIGAVLIAIVLIARTYLEDRMLVRELPGYADYARKVKWRLVPGGW